MQIHPTAVVDPEAVLDGDVSVGPFSCIGPRVRVGAGCRIGPHVAIIANTTIGPGCSIRAGAVIGDDPQDLGFKGGETFLQMGARCVVRECVTIHRGTADGSTTVIGDDCFFMACSHVAHNCQIGDRVILANGVLLGGHVHIGERAFLAGNSIVHQFVHIGRLVMLGGGTGASKDVPPFCMTRALGLNRVAGLNVVGLRRAGFSPEDRREVKKCFDLLYRSGLNISQALEQLKGLEQKGPVAEFVAFVEGSKRGLCAFGAGNDD